ncbi:hypothetical protein TWF694_006370 [Orbilia ellipsospora]|uniref:cellulase n=1 Tax=Orbilia ellipsospora TaxID=2528407 RepID=A0AAV9XKV8_9PEZI
MPTIMSKLIPFTLLVSSAFAQQPAWAQCGGQGYAGGTTCVSGYQCVYLNQWYSQCQPGAAAQTTTAKTTARTTTTSASTPTGASTSNGKLKWLGVDESVAEWGTAFPGVQGVDYTFPSTSTIATLASQGYNIFRVPFAMERMAVGSVTAPLASGYLAGYTNVINAITNSGAWAVIDPHNYGRYNGQIITDTNAFGVFWTNVANAFKNNPKVIFDINNEFNTMDQSLVVALNQAGINAIRATGATQYIFAEGNMWTGTSTWATINDSMKTLTDPLGKLIYEMHEYLNSDGSGSTGDCVSTTIGVDRITDATNWLKANGKLGVLGEFSGGANSMCYTAIKGLMDHLQANSNVWLGAIWWAAGPWWPAGTYGDFEPPNGAGYQYYNSLLKQYLP